MGNCVCHGQRKAKVEELQWSDIDADGVWTVRTQKGEKGNIARVKLPPLAFAIIQRQPTTCH